MITREEVIHIAKLARLDLSEKEIEKMQKDLSSILDYFNILKKAPKLKEKKSVSKAPSSLRKDEALPKDDSLKNKLVAQAPAKKDNYIKVKSIL